MSHFINDTSKVCLALCSFNEVTQGETKCIIRSMKSSTCALITSPTVLLKMFILVLSPKIVNSCLQSGFFLKPPSAGLYFRKHTLHQDIWCDTGTGMFKIFGLQFWRKPHDIAENDIWTYIRAYSSLGHHDMI